MAKKRSVSTSRADREDDRRRRNAPLRARSSGDKNEMTRQWNMRAGDSLRDPADRYGRFSDATVGKLARGTARVLIRDAAREWNSNSRFNENKSRVSKVGRTSSRFSKSPDLSKAAGGQPTQRQKRLTVAKAEKNRQTSAARSAGRKKASAAKRRER